MDASIVEAGFPVTEAAPAKKAAKKAAKPKLAKKAVKKAAKPKLAKKAVKKTAKKPSAGKRLVKAAKQARKAVKKTAKPAGAGVRTHRVDLRLTGSEKSKLQAKAKATRRTVTSIMLELIEKMR